VHYLCKRRKRSVGVQPENSAERGEQKPGYAKAEVLREANIGSAIDWRSDWRPDRHIGRAEMRRRNTPSGGRWA